MGPQEYQTECATPSIDIGARTCHYTFLYSGNIETFVLPPTTEPVRITAVGAPGAGARGLQSRGATVTGSFASLSGVPIFITVGGDGTYDGFNGGGLGGGGGASDVRLGGAEFDHRIMVAGGGGGGGYYGGGGAGGCVGSNPEGTALCLDSQPGSGGGGSSLLPPGGSVLPNDDPTPRITITVTQYTWWKT